MAPRLGKVVLGLSAAGFPLTQLAIRRLGRRGAIVTEGACVGLAVRDAAMIAAGTPSRLRSVPAAFLWLELVAAMPQRAWDSVWPSRGKPSGDPVASGICWKSFDGLGSSARVG